MLSFVVGTLRNSAQAQQSASLITCGAGHDALPSPMSACSPQRSTSTFQILIANPRLEPKLSSNHPSQLQISNRERMAFCRSGPSREPSITSSAQPLSSNLQLLIVTPRLKSPATPTKQNSNPISNRYKSPFFAPLSRSALSTRLSSLVSCHPALAPVAPTSRKAIMCRNHFTQFPRSKPLMRKVTNADSNQS
jgi:hypothetical protein